MPGQYWAVGTSGGTGIGAVPYITERLRVVSQPEFKLRQMVDAKEAVGSGRGDTWLFNKRQNVRTQGGRLVETDTIPETEYTYVQATGTIDEWGNSVPFTFKARQLERFDIDSETEMALRDDLVKVLESAAGDEFMKSEYVAVCTATNGVAITTNGTATATATGDASATNVRAIVNFMRKKLIPKYDGTSYACVASISFLSGMFDDGGVNGWTDLSKYTSEFARNPLNGEVGNYYMTRFVDETGYLSNTIGASSAHGQAIFLGNDCVYEGVSVPEEIRVDTPKDFQREFSVAWYALLGFKIVWNLANDGEQHIVVVTSA